MPFQETKEGATNFCPHTADNSICDKCAGIVKEICICAAVKFVNNNKQELIIKGHRHGDCFYNKFKRPDHELWKEEEQGFITSKNRFVSRIEGRQLQDAAGIESVSNDGYVGNTLYSEDLY